MRAVIQRVKEASVVTSGEEVGRIEKGFLIYLGIEKDDEDKDLLYITNKVKGLRVFTDSLGKMNLNLSDVCGKILVVSQFTLYGDVRKGNRPSFVTSADSEKGRYYYNRFCAILAEEGFVVEKGRFQSDMAVYSVNDGPVTILLDSSKLF